MQYQAQPKNVKLEMQFNILHADSRFIADKKRL